MFKVVVLLFLLLAVACSAQNATGSDSNATSTPAPAAAAAAAADDATTTTGTNVIESTLQLVEKGATDFVNRIMMMGTELLDMFSDWAEDGDDIC